MNPFESISKAIWHFPSKFWDSTRTSFLENDHASTFINATGTLAAAFLSICLTIALTIFFIQYSIMLFTFFAKGFVKPLIKHRRKKCEADNESN